LKLASGVSDLISELDLMLSCCCPLTKVRHIIFCFA
jgi:hypothetical protein